MSAPEEETPVKDMTTAEQEFDLISKQFDDKTHFADIVYLHKSWQSNILLPDSKTIIPSERMFIADINGNIVFDRTVTIVGLINMIEHISKYVENSLTLVEKLKEYKINLPVSESFVVQRMEVAKRNVDKSLEILKSKSIEFTDMGFSSGEAPDTAAQ